jgi:gas vesicle protein
MIHRPEKGDRLMAQNDNTGMLRGLLLGLIAGGALGAILGLLYAPKSGKELRADIREKADNLLEGADEQLKTAQSQAGQILSDAKVRSAQLIDDAKKRADTLLHDADKILSDVRQKGGTVANAVKAGVDAYEERRKV